MTFSSPTRDGQQCPPPPPSSPARRNTSAAINSQQQQRTAQQRGNSPPPSQQQIASLLQYAQSSYTTNPTDALSALMDALTLTTGTNAAAQHAMDRIRFELGDSVADCVAGHDATNNYSMPHARHSPSQSATNPMSEREMTLRAMAVVQELLNDTSTILYAQGKQHLLQQAMEDGSSVVCSRCGDMISRERLTQHMEYWCRAIEEEKSCEDGEGMVVDG
eukprot:CAMPEP_0172544812 /NCGR_PEP_ID=MMETSP1067-20121228/14881_1 /TAXON_ID=265564 ORGANISM="Thalassiosira punctigera, Strain Tpunct2005C2" /NCGR_SAMPLE_ID=MMETSP1067 /ASSEMBLY_ACC=CAM_ASM_000444 /LENGTH=218 /DNA_ID=CAMNT_0013331435 /DNA_START=34 /DNA_END=690 /DNA_ORIENTATION=+